MGPLQTEARQQALRSASTIEWRLREAGQWAAHAARDGKHAAELLAQVPKLAPYREEIRANLATALGIDPGAVGIKATTTDHIGPIGEGQALAAQAVALLKEIR